MPRRDLLTYDVDQRRSSWSGPNPRLVILLVVVLAMAVVLVIWTARSASPGSTTPAHAQSSVATAGRSPSATPPRRSASPALVGSDARTSERAPAGSRTAAARFVAAWLERDPHARKIALQETATPGLSEQLMLTATSNIPKAAAHGDPVLEHASEYSVQFVQNLTNRMRVRIYLVADPQARFGWVASSVEQA